MTLPMSRESPGVQRQLASQYLPLFNIVIAHDYYNATNGQSNDFSVVPTPDCAALMRKLKLVFKDFGNGFAVMVDRSAVAQLQSFIAGRASGSPPDWTWLTFQLVPVRSEMIGISRLPIGMNPMVENLYVNNLASRAGHGASAPWQTIAMDLAALRPVVASSLSAPNRAGATPRLLAISGAPAPAASTAGADKVEFSLTGLPLGFYQIGWSDPAGRALPPDPPALLVADAPPRPLAMIDLILARPDATTGHATAFPFGPQQGPTPAPESPAPVSLRLHFRARETLWRYYIVPQRQSGQFLPDLEITGADAIFTPTDTVLPNGDKAVLFTTKTPLSLQQRCTHRFKLSGQRQRLNGGRDDISVDWLPAPPATPVWPVPDGDPLSGTSEIYVYV